MASRVGIALAIFLGVPFTFLGAHSTTSAQVVRFDTTVGSFDMVLNPTGLPVLQAHVDNLLRYIENGNYNGTWINRAGNNPDTGEDFVLQLGGFFSQTDRPPMTLASARRVNKFAPVAGEPARETGLSNTVGTVAMALGSDRVTGQVLQDSGTSEFFVNIKDNSFLDQNFTVFARVSDMTTVNRIMTLTDVNLSQRPPFNGDSTTFGDVPIEADGSGVFITRAFVVDDGLTVALAMANVEAAMASDASAASAASMTSAVGGAGVGSSSPLHSSSAVPEPGSLLLAALFSWIPFAMRRRRK